MVMATISRHRLRAVRETALWFLALGICGPALVARGEGYSPDEAVRQMVVPPGFHVEVVASEPMIRQPVTASFDERGRVWVIEYLQYPVPAGLKPVTVDQYLRTKYDRVPEPPPRGPRGADRIKILEDTDGDGKADKATTFVEGLNLASGLALGHGGVFVGQAPYLLFYPDKDKDDRPDGDPEVLLSGFGLEDAHATVNSMQWGPDGWLYGAQGSTVTANIRGIEFQQGIWRYHPRTKAFELFAEGGGNTWGLDFDKGGNAFGSSNGHFVTFHMIQGGNYWKGFAKHGPLHNPNTFGYFNALNYQGQKPGGHVTPGGIVYETDAYPSEFQGAFIGGNLLSNSVYWHRLGREGSTFSASYGGTLLDAKDPWFRPIDLLVGPDGAVNVVDWYDKRASHLNPRDNWDKTNGRIYKIVYGQGQKVAPFDLGKRSSEELLALRKSHNDWYANEARRILAERQDPNIIPALKTYLSEDRDETLALRDLWALYVSGGLDDSTALGLLNHEISGVRRWTVRLLGDERRMNPSLHASLVELAQSDPDAMVRSQLAASCQRWEMKDALPILARLIQHEEDLTDLHIPLMIWWAFEHHLREHRDDVVALLTEKKAFDSKIVDTILLERIARVLTSRGTSPDLDACAKLLAVTSRTGQVDALIAGFEKGLEGRKPSAIPPSFEAALARLWIQPTPSTQLIRLGLRLGSPAAISKAVDRVYDTKTPETDRIALIEVLGQIARKESLDTLFTLVVNNGSSALRLAALSALASFQAPEIASRLLTAYPGLPPALRDRALAVLSTRPIWAASLLEAMSQGKVTPKELRTAQVQQILQFHDSALTKRLETLWGRLPRSGSPEKVRRIAEIRGLLPEGDKGNAARGQAVFKENCAVCHRLFEEGEQIGPDLTGAERANLDFLLTSIIDPSAEIRKEYQAQSIALVDGRVLSGLVLEETANTITLIDSNRQKTVIPRDQVEETKPSDVSLMPEGQLDKLRDDQIRDLFRYLQSTSAITGAARR